MTLGIVEHVLQATVLTQDFDPYLPVESAFCSDMMSNVLAYGANKSILITGMYNAQVLRTAEMLGMSCVIMVGRRDPDPDTVELANELEICLMRTDFSMFTTCGLLYSEGLRGRGSDEQ